MPDEDDPPRPAGLPPLSAVLPPLLLGTATFNTQYVDDPATMPYRAIVRRALVDLDVRGFDTSPYYGPSEALLGEALAATGVDRSRYFLETKAGRVTSNGFDYSPAAVQASVRRSLARLRTDRVDLVYAHDAEFVAPEEVVGAVRALRQLRSEGLLRYVGISGFPVEVLASLAERVLRETGEPVDAVLSYGHGTVQNQRLVREEVLGKFRQAGVAVVLNASLLNMGLLTTRGVDAGPQAAWHPSPPELRQVCARAAQLAQHTGIPGITGIERLALRYALDLWSRAGAAAGLGTTATAGATGDGTAVVANRAVGASVLGVTSEAELTETVLEWWSVLDALGVLHPSLPEEEEADQGHDKAAAAGTRTAAVAAESGAATSKRAASLRRTQQVKAFVQEKLWPTFGTWRDYAWASPPEGWVNELKPKSNARL